MNRLVSDIRRRHRPEEIDVAALSTKCSSTGSHATPSPRYQSKRQAFFAAYVAGLKIPFHLGRLPGCYSLRAMEQLRKGCTYRAPSVL
jgi:hypothetical protein